MKITKVDIPETENPNDGLDAIQMDKLGKLVLIAGKNGSGKTRILNKIFRTLNIKPGISSIPNQQRIEELKNSIIQYENEIDRLKTSLTIIANPLKSNVNSQIIEYENIILSLNKQIDLVNWNEIETDVATNKYSSVFYVPKNLNLKDSNSFTKTELKTKALHISNITISQLPEKSFAIIQIIQDRWHNATHPELGADPESLKIAVDDYDRLKEIIRVFLGTEITRNLDGDAMIFGFPLGGSNLSDGQKILLQFCIALFCQEVNLKDLILVMDEPENHLHPSVIIETIDRILNAVSNGQVWISTHSIPLLAHFDPSNLWFVDNGKISYAGRIPEKVLESLLGNEAEIGKLQDFISLPAQYATNRYAFESLFDPPAVMTKFNDPQSIQVKEELSSISNNGKLRVLDFGVGKGRLISNVSELEKESQDKIIELIDYVGYDKFNENQEECLNSIGKVFSDSSSRYFNDFDRLHEIYDKESFDVVIMCNVLHEIDPTEWLSLFSKNGTICDCLKDDGILLLIEDQQIPTGEKAYQKGFLVLDTVQLKDLFKISESDEDFKISQKKDGRLKAHQIPKRLLQNIDKESRIKAIQSISNTAKNKILSIREDDKNYKNGKLHGFWTQQFANAQLNLAELTNQ